MRIWLAQHRAALRDALRRLAGAPLGNILSLLVIGIVLTLPAAGWLALDNLGKAVGNAAGSQQISIFLNPDAERRDIGEIESRLRTTVPGQWRFIARETALKRLQDTEGMAEIVASLPRNPLPDAFVIEPADTRPDSLETLAGAFREWPKVAHVQLDSAWVKRFDAFLRIARLALSLLGGLLAAALVAVTFNTIRLQILAQADEIEVARLIGATDAFIRRPFQYYGALQGAFGGLLASLLIAVGSHLLSGPVGELVALYGGSFALHGPSSRDALLLTAAGAALGWRGAAFSVALHLRRETP